MNILFICHKVPYPPDKGEKIRTFNIIKHLSRHHKIFLYSLCDKKEDLKHGEQLKAYCASVDIYYIRPGRAFLRMLACIFTKRPFTLGYFSENKMKRCIDEKIKTTNMDILFASCSSSAQYIMDIKNKKKIVDLIDVDSDKWKQLGKAAWPPLSLVYLSESKRLERIEKDINEAFEYSIVTTDREKEKLGRICPLGKEKVCVVNNGVDNDFFGVEHNAVEAPVLIFTGQMDYPPNVDSAIYFYKKILPIIKKSVPDTLFYIVGRSPSPLIRIICREAITTGYVKDIRKYLAGACVYVAPMRLVFGVENKILEAMAFGLPVVATTEVSKTIKAVPGKDIIIKDEPGEFANAVIELLSDRGKRDLITENAKKYVKTYHDWEKNLAVLDAVLTR